MSGWIKLHRCLLHKPIFENEKLLKVWIWCLGKAYHKDTDILLGRTKIKVKTGQFVTGRNKYSSELGMKPTTAYEYLQLLKLHECIDIQSDSKKTIITVINWAYYQSENEKSDSKHDSKHDSKSTANRQQIDTYKNDKNGKNDKEYIETFEALWKLYPRKMGKASVSDTAKKKLHKVGYDIMVKAINNFKKQMEKENRPADMYPYGSTFFTKGYTDYLPKEPEPAKEKKVVDRFANALDYDEVMRAREQAPWTERYKN